MQPLISVIVPVFNTGIKVRDCINSILSQTYSRIEIIVVDDGSTDTITLDILHDIIKVHPQIKLVTQTNGGPSKARNTGIDASNGDYITFVDSDDTIDEDAYSSLMRIVLKYNVPIVLGALCYESQSVSTQDSTVKLNEGVYFKNEILSMFLRGSWHSACTNLYSRELIGETKFPLNEINEDYVFNFEILRKIERAAVSIKPFYHYIKHENSRTTSLISKDHLQWIEHTIYIREMVINEGLFHLMPEADYQYIFANIVLANKSLMSLNQQRFKEAHEIFNIAASNLKEHKKIILQNKYLSLRYKVMGYFLSKFAGIYKFFILLLLKIVK